MWGYFHACSIRSPFYHPELQQKVGALEKVVIFNKTGNVLTKRGMLLWYKNRFSWLLVSVYGCTLLVFCMFMPLHVNFFLTWLFVGILLPANMHNLKRLPCVHVFYCTCLSYKQEGICRTVFNWSRQLRLQGGETGQSVCLLSVLILFLNILQEMKKCRDHLD